MVNPVSTPRIVTDGDLAAWHVPPGPPPQSMERVHDSNVARSRSLSSTPYVGVR